MSNMKKLRKKAFDRNDAFYIEEKDRELVDDLFEICIFWKDDIKSTPFSGYPAGKELLEKHGGIFAYSDGTYYFSIKGSLALWDYLQRQYVQSVKTDYGLFTYRPKDCRGVCEEEYAHEYELKHKVVFMSRIFYIPEDFVIVARFYTEKELRAQEKMAEKQRRLEEAYRKAVTKELMRQQFYASPHFRILKNWLSANHDAWTYGGITAVIPFYIATFVILAIVILAILCALAEIEGKLGLA